LSVVYAECHVPFVLSVGVLSVVMLSVVEPVEYLPHRPKLESNHRVMCLKISLKELGIQDPSYYLKLP
jgi:hypothetical protein